MNTGQCGASRRRGRGSRASRASRGKKMRGGNFYGVGEPIAPGVLGYKVVPNNAADAATGRELPTDTSNPQPAKLGGRRRSQRKGKKTAKRHGRRHGRRRTMRGGANQVSIAPAGGSFTGKGDAGLISLDRYSVNVPGGDRAQGPDGVYSA